MTTITQEVLNDINAETDYPVVVGFKRLREAAVLGECVVLTTLSTQGYALLNA